MNNSKALAALAVPLALIMCLGGCQRHPATAPVKGKVLYNGEPLAFGGVMFQPQGGQPGRGVIQADGSFELTTYEPGDGAAVGEHRVRVTCFEIQDPRLKRKSAEEDPAFGKNLIPEKYNMFDSSPLKATVVAGQLNQFTFELK